MVYWSEPSSCRCDDVEILDVVKILNLTKMVDMKPRINVFKMFIKIDLFLDGIISSIDTSM